MPGNRQAFSEAMEAAERQHWSSQWAEAAQAYQRALAEFPEDATARSGLGYCYVQTRQWQQALEEYEFLLKQDAGNVIALSKTAELYGILNRRVEAYGAYLHLADIYAQAGQGARAEAAWQKAVQLSPGDPEPHERLAGYYFEKKDIAQMIQHRLAAAQGHLLRNELALARKQCEEVLRADETDTQAQQLLMQILRASVNAPDFQISEAGAAAYTSDAQISEAEATLRSSVDPEGSAGRAESREPVAEALSDSTNSARSTPVLNSTDSIDSTAFTANSEADTSTSGNTSGGKTGIMGNMGSADNFGGSNPGPSLAMAGNGGGVGSAPRKRISASQVTGVLKQAQTFQTQGRFNDAIDLCEQILESGFDRPDARYFLGWLYQEQQRWDEAIHQFQLLLNDPDYALSCYYALGQCYRARGDLRTATVHFDEAVDRVNLDALTAEESDQLVQLCQEAAEAHRLLGEQEQAMTIYNALLGFLRSRGWSDKVAQVEFMLQQAQNVASAPQRPVTPPAGMPQQGMTQPPVAPQQPQPPAYPQPAPQTAIPEAPTMAFDVASQPMSFDDQGSTMAVNIINNGPNNPQTMPPGQAAGELPDWLTGILSDSDKTVVANKKPTPPPPPPSAPVTEQPTIEQRVPSANLEAMAPPPPPPVQQPQQQPQPAVPSWLMDDAKPGNATQVIPPEQLAPEPTMQAQPPMPAPVAPPAPPAPTQPGQSAQLAAQQNQLAQQAQTIQDQSAQLMQALQAIQAMQAMQAQQAMQAPAAQPVPQAPVPAPPPMPVPAEQPYLVVPDAPAQTTSEPRLAAEDLLNQMAGSSGDLQVAEALAASTASLPENVRQRVVRSMQDIQRYVNHGLLSSATEECLRVIDIAPQYLDVHQVLCEIYVRQGKIEQAITKYAILVDTYIVNGRTEDAITTYRRILQLEPNNLTYRMRLISLLSSQGNKEDLLRERTLAAESYLRLGYMDRALTELEQALQESPTSVPTRLNYALALQKLGRSQQAVAEYQRVLQVDPRNVIALMRWHIAMITSIGTPRSTTLEVLTRIRWQLRGEGQKMADMVLREYQQALETYPNNADVQFSLGQLYQQCGQFDRAIDSYMLSLRDTSIEVLARASAAQALLSQGKPEAAIQQFEQALQVVRHSPAAVEPSTWAARPREEGEEHQAPEKEISMQLARAYGRTGRQEQMQAILRQVQQVKPVQDEVHSTLAEISARQSDLDSTLREYLDLVRHYRNSRQIDNAISVLNEMVRMAPQDARPHAELADVYINRGLLEEGIAELRLLADINLRRSQMEQASETLQRIGNLYDEMGDAEEALINLCRAAELNPEAMDLLREVVALCWRQGRMDEAVRYQTSIARHYFETHQVKEAVAALQQLIAIDRNNHEAYDMLGQTYQSVGEYEQASRVYRNLAKVNPGSPVARERLATLQELRMRS